MNMSDSECITAEMQHEIDAADWPRRWSEISKKLREEGKIL
jgi:hypothetical protein